MKLDRRTPRGTRFPRFVGARPTCLALRSQQITAKGGRWRRGPAIASANMVMDEVSTDDVRRMDGPRAETAPVAALAGRDATDRSRPGTPTAAPRRLPLFPALARTILACVLALAAFAPPALAQMDAPNAVGDVLVLPVARTTDSLAVSWTAPDNAGKPALTGYEVRHMEARVSEWTVVSVDVDSTSVALDGLRGNGFFDVEVRALNADHSGPWSATAEGITHPTPETVLANNPLVPDDLGPGDPFRRLYVTGTTTAATGALLSDYINLVQNEIFPITESGNLLAEWGRFEFGQAALVSLPAADARVLTDATWTTTERGVPIYWVNGARVADDYADFYDGAWADEDNPTNGEHGARLPVRSGGDGAGEGAAGSRVVPQGYEGRTGAVPGRPAVRCTRRSADAGARSGAQPCPERRDVVAAGLVAT